MYSCGFIFIVGSILHKSSFVRTTMMSVMVSCAIILPWCQWWCHMQSYYHDVSDGVVCNHTTMMSVMVSCAIILPWCQWWCRVQSYYHDVSDGVVCNHTTMMSVMVSCAIMGFFWCL